MFKFLRTVLAVVLAGSLASVCGALRSAKLLSEVLDSFTLRSGGAGTLQLQRLGHAPGWGLAEDRN